MAFGYEGDATGDSLSLAGTGAFAFDDPERGGTPMVPLQDAALKTKDAELIYNVKPGEFFTAPDGTTHRYADIIPDWSPAKPGYVDVYDPAHAPDSATTKGSNVSLRSGYDWTSPGTDDDTQTGDYIDDSKDQVELTNQQPIPRQRLSPLDSFKIQFPEFRSTHDAILIEKMHERMAPDMPMEQFAKLAAMPDGGRAIQIELNKGLTGLQILRRDFAEFKATDDQLLHGMYDRLSGNLKIDPQVINFQDFKDQMDPGSGPLNAAYNFWKGFSRSASAATHEAAQQIYAKPQNAIDFANEFYKLMNFGGNIASPGSNVGTAVQSWAKSADQWMAKNTSAENYWRDFVGWMNGFGQSQARGAVRDIKRASQTRGVGGKESFFGKSGRVIGQSGAGGLLSLATIYMPGAPIKTAAMLASAYEGLSATGAAVQAGHDNALIEGLQAAGMAPLMRYMMDSPAGRKVSAFTMWAANNNEDVLDKWLKGEKVDWYEQGLRSSVDILLGAFAGKEEKEGIRDTGLGEYAAGVGSVRDVKTSDILGTDLSGGGVWFARDPISVRRPPSVFTPKTFQESVSRLPKKGSPEEMRTAAERMRPAGGGAYFSEPLYPLEDFLHPGVSEEIDKAFEARENGDYHAAAEHADAAMSIATPKQRDDVAKTIIRVTHDAANIHNGDTPNKPEPVPDRSDDIIHQNLYGITPKRNKGIRTTRESGFTLDWAGEMHDWFQDAWPEIKRKLKGPVRGVASVFERNIHDVFTPREGSETGAAMDVISAERTSEAARRANIFSTKMARDMQLDKDIKGGEKTGRRTEVFDGFRDGQLKDILVNEEEHGDEPPNTGNKAADFILRFHRVGYKAMRMVEDAAGIKYDAVKSYIFHNLKDPRRGEEFYKWFDNLVANDPRFAKRRGYPTLRDALSAGYEMKTLNPERLFQARLFAHTEAIRKIFTLRDAADENGIAFRKDDPNLEPEIKTWVEVTSPERDINGNHVTYYVEPGAAKVLKNAWDTRKIYDVAFVGPIVRMAAVGKGLTASLKLAWSIAHPKHVIKIGLSHSLAQMTKMALTGERRAEAWQKAVGDVFKAGITNDREVKAWRGEALDRPLTHEEEANIADAQSMGLDFSTNSERNMQFARGLAELFPQWAKGFHGLNQAVSHGYRLLSSEFLQKYIFNDIIPRIKFNAAMSVRDNIMREHPEYNNPGMEMARKQALRRAGEAIDARFGEMFYNNLYWSKMAKDLGQSSLLSLGWQIGFVRVFGGALKDMSSNVAHMGEIKNKFLGHPSEHTFLTDRILFAGYYTALNVLEAGIFTYAAMKLSGADDKDAFPKWRDYVYPRTGRDNKGRDMRVQPIEYSREFVSWHHHIMQEGGYPMGALKGSSDFWANKLQPFLQTLNQDWQNRNYYGLEVADKGDPNQWNQFVDHAKFWASNLFLPIPFEGAFENTGGDYNLADAARGAAGYPKAPAWTTRTDTENRIADKYHTRFSGTKSQADLDKQNAHQALRKAVLDKDETARQKAEDALKAMNVKSSAIRKLEKEAHIPYETYMFKRLAPHDQQEILDQMSPDELKIYVPLAHKELRGKYVVHSD